MSKIVTFLTNEDEQRILLESEGISDKNVHALYFDITPEGTIFLKPEYRGGPLKIDPNDYNYDISDMGSNYKGSKNHLLPKHLIIPSVVNNIRVTSLAEAIFRFNAAIEEVTLCDAIIALPILCFSCAYNLRKVNKTK
jgi:hypothetical protein